MSYYGPLEFLLYIHFIAGALLRFVVKKNEAMKYFIVFFLGSLPLITSDCYFRDGTNVLNGQYVPCRLTSASMCCGTNRGYNVDSCMDNGLCNAAYSEKLYRESCTDPTWASPYCLGNICTNTTASQL